MILCSLALPALHYPCLAGLRHHTFTIQAAPLLAFDSTASQGCTSFSNSVLPSVCPASENDNWAREEQSWNPPFLTPALAGPSTNPARWAEWKPHPNVCVLVRELALEARDDVPPLPAPTTAPSCPCCAVLPGQGMKARATGGFSAQISHTLMWHSYASSLAFMAIGSGCILQSPWRGYIQREESPRKCQGPKADLQGQVSSRLQSSWWLFQPV